MIMANETVEKAATSTPDYKTTITLVGEYVSQEEVDSFLATYDNEVLGLRKVKELYERRKSVGKRLESRKDPLIPKFEEHTSEISPQDPVELTLVETTPRQVEELIYLEEEQSIAAAYDEKTALKKSREISQTRSVRKEERPPGPKKSGKLEKASLIGSRIENIPPKLRKEFEETYGEANLGIGGKVKGPYLLDNDPDIIELPKSIDFVDTSGLSNPDITLLRTRITKTWGTDEEEDEGGEPEYKTPTKTTLTTHDLQWQSPEKLNKTLDRILRGERNLTF